MAATLNIGLLGDFRLSYGDQPVTRLNTPCLQSLLAYLLLHRGAPQSRQHIAFLFWPDATEAQARNNLRQFLHQLRQTLPDASVFIHADASTLSWQVGNGDAFTLDVADFERTLAEAATAQGRGDGAGVRAALEKAVTLYRGDLLPSCYDDWITPERDRLRARCMDALKRLARLLEEQREYLAAIPHAQRLIEFDLLDEAAYLNLMRLHALNGDLAAVRRIYQQCAEALQRDLGIEPSAVTREAYERLLQAHAPGARKRPDASPGTPSLIGRQREWEQLRSAWQRASVSESHLVLISGEAGIGKTRLAEELLMRANQQGFVAARTRSYAAEGRLALAPVIEWLRSDAVRQSLTRLDDVWLTEISRILPELVAERADLPRPEPMTEFGQRQRFFEALARAVFTEPKPLLLLIDDLQWCDQETLEWLRFLLRFDLNARLLVIGTSRVEEVMPPHPVTQWLVHLRNEGRVTEIGLAALDAAETAKLATQVAHRELDDESATQLYRETEGNPLFVVEMARAGLSKGAEGSGRGGERSSASRLPSTSARLPPRVHAVIAGRLTQLSPQARELAGLAATVGRAFTVEVLAKASGMDEDSLTRGLDELWQRRIVRDQTVNSYDFSHDKIRDVAYVELSPIRQRHWHLRVAQALEAIQAADLDPVSAQLAAHYEQAGVTERAIEYYQRAAEVAQRVFAYEEAVSLINRGLFLLPMLPHNAQRDEQELALLILLGVAFSVTMNYQVLEQLDILARAQALGQQLGKPPNPSILRALATNHILRANYGQSRLLGEQLLQLAEQLRDPILIVEGHEALGITHFWIGAFEQARMHLEQAIVQYAPEHSHTHIARFAWDSKVICLGRLALDLWCLGYPDQAVQAQQESLKMAQSLGHPPSLGYTMFWDALLQHMLGNVDLVRVQTEATIKLSQEHHLVWWLRQATTLHGWAVAAGSELEPDIAEMQRRMAEFYALGTVSFMRPFYFTLLAQLYAKLGRVEHGLELLANASAITEDTNERWHEAELHRVLGELLLVKGADAREVEAAYCRAIEIAQVQHAKSFKLRAATSLAWLWQVQGKAAEARNLLAPVYDWFTEGFDTHDLQEARTLLEQLSK